MEMDKLQIKVYGRYNVLSWWHVLGIPCIYDAVVHSCV
jgi:hypothetical protein